MKADIFKTRVNTLVGSLLIGSFATWMGSLIVHAANSLPQGIPPGL